MPQKPDEPVVRVHLWLYKDDVEWLDAVYGDKGAMGRSTAVRTLVRKYRRGIEEKAQASARRPEVEVKLDEQHGEQS